MSKSWEKWSLIWLFCIAVGSCVAPNVEVKLDYAAAKCDMGGE